MEFNNCQLLNKKPSKLLMLPEMVTFSFSVHVFGVLLLRNGSNTMYSIASDALFCLILYYITLNYICTKRWNICQPFPTLQIHYSNTDISCVDLASFTNFCQYDLRTYVCQFVTLAHAKLGTYLQCLVIANELSHFVFLGNITHTHTQIIKIRHVYIIVYIVLI